MPLDPLSNGSWIGASDAGIVACLLNANPKESREPDAEHPDASGMPSQNTRGRMVPTALSADSVESAAEAICDECDEHTLPFTLLVLNLSALAVVRWDGQISVVEYSREIPKHYMLTSSGMGDHVVESPRRRLYEQMFAKSDEIEHAQDNFHSYRWEESGHTSVLMSRPRARTVSQTVVTATPSQTLFKHVRLNDELDPIGLPEKVSLPISRSIHD
jgi:hypothetical protein